MALAGSSWTPTGDGSQVGLFFPLPKHLASKYPSLGDWDASPPHVTLLYVGEVPKRKEKLFVSTLRAVLSQQPSPITAKIGPPDVFVQPDRDLRVWHSRVYFSKDMATIRDRICAALEDVGFQVQNAFPLSFEPHVTLEYQKGAQSKAPWIGLAPQGSWEIQSVQVWGISELVDVPFGSYVPQPFLSAAESRMARRVAARWV